MKLGTTAHRCFGNIYLNEADRYIKHKLHIKYYSRYMDDSVILIKTKEENKVKYLRYEIKNGRMTCKHAKRYLAGHLGYIKIADTYNLENKLFYNSYN